MIKNFFLQKNICRGIFMMAGLFVFFGSVNFANAAPSLVGNWIPNDANILDTPYSVAVSGSYAYVTGYNSINFAIVDISDPTDPTLIGNWDPNDSSVMYHVRSVAVSGSYAYVVGATSDNLAIVDISDPTDPTLVGNWDPNDTNVMDSPYSVAVSGSYAYVVGATSDNLAIVDISDPTDPTLVGNWDPNDTNVMDSPYSVAVSGSYAYVSGGISDNLAIVDISDPTDPTLVGNWDPNDSSVMNRPQSIVISGSYVYVAGFTSDNLAIVDISDPTDPTLVGNWDPNDSNVMNSSNSVKISGSYVYITGQNSHNLAIVDISDPTDPTLAGNWDPNDTNVMELPTSVAIFDSYAFVTASRTDNLAIIDISDFISSANITIQDPNNTKIQDAVTDGHVTVDNGTIDNTTQTTTQTNITFASTNANALFPTGTVITEQGNSNYNFQNFTIADINIPNTAAAIDLGIPGTDLSFSQDITLALNVGDTYNDQTLNVYSQSTGQTDWTLHTTCTVSEGDCTFTTNHATIYTAGGIPGAIPIDINVEVQDTLTLDCYDTQGTTGDYTVTLGTTTDPGKVTPGSPATGQSTCTVTTNDDQGYYLTLIDDNAATNTVLTHTDPHTGSIYEIQDLTQFPATTTWTTPITKGLGFSVVTFPDTQTDNNILDETWTNTSLCPEGNNPDTNTYAGIPDTAETISAVTQYESLSTTTNICYKVDVPASQASGQYTGSVTYTATSDASSYLN